MPQYYFILGKNPLLSLAELDQHFAARQIDVEAFAQNKEYCLLQLTKELDLVALLQHLGGTMKAGECVGEFATREEALVALQQEEWMRAHLPLKKHRVEFGISVYGANKAGPLAKRYGQTLKKALQASGHSARMIFDPTGSLSSVTVAKNGLLGKGFEMTVLEHHGKVWIGVTRAVQSFRKFGERDYGRPDRDARSGMLPPKLALMMLNIAGAKSDSVVLDPFCGSGTVLQEAVLLECKKVYGSDVSEKAVKDSQSNLQWLAKKEKQTSQVQTRRIDARHLRPSYDIESVDIMVTEPDLGPPRPVRNEEQIEERRREAAKLYREFLSSAAKVIKPEGRIVMVWPVWWYQENDYRLHPKKVLSNDWELSWPYSSLVPAQKEKTLLYERAGQFVSREIVVLTKRHI